MRPEEGLDERVQRLRGVAFATLRLEFGAAVVMGPVGLMTVLWDVLTIAGQRHGKAQKTRRVVETIELMAGAPTPRSDASNAVMTAPGDLPEN